jgi:chromosomal replication initiation ATPase DnaA
MLRRMTSEDPRTTFVRNAAVEAQLDLPDHVINRVAADRSIPDGEVAGALIRVSAFARLSSVTPAVDLTERLLAAGRGDA